MIFQRSVIASIALAATFDVAAAAGRRLKKTKSAKSDPIVPECITEGEAFTAIDKFATAVSVVQSAVNGGGCAAAVGVGAEYIQENYAYNQGDGLGFGGGGVLFKPTVSSSPYTLRNTFLGAASYFVGTQCMVEAGLAFPDGNDDLDESDRSFSENGFGTSNGIVNATFPIGWKYLTSENNPAYCGVVVAAGQICFDQGGSFTCVDKTFTIIRGDEDAGQEPFIISSHHSSKVVVEDTCGPITRNRALAPAVCDSNPTQTICQDIFDPTGTDLPSVNLPQCNELWAA